MGQGVIDLGLPIINANSTALSDENDPSGDLSQLKPNYLSYRDRATKLDENGSSAELPQLNPIVNASSTVLRDENDYSGDLPQLKSNT